MAFLIRLIFGPFNPAQNGPFSPALTKDRTQEGRKDLPENFNQLLEKAIQLKREVPSRSVNQIILILELEGSAKPGT